MQKEKNIQQKSQRRINDIVTSIAVMSTLIESERVSFNNYPIDGKLRRDAMSYEMDQLIKKIGFTDKQVQEYAKDLDWSETSPEQMEFNNALSAAMQIFLLEQKNDNDGN